MKTPWGDVAVCDAHVHYFSHRFFSVLAQQKGGLPAEALGPLLGWEIPSPGPEALAARWVSELDRSAVESAIVIASVPGDEDSVIAAVELYPERFSGYFMVDPTVADAPGRVSRALGRGMRGVCLFPAMQGYSVTDARVYAVLEEASRHPRAEVFVHCGVLTLGVRRKLGLPGVFDTRNSNPLDLIPVAARFQSLTFVVPHFGAGFFREALMLCDLCPNVVLDTSSSNGWMRYEGLTLEGVFRRALDVAGPRRLRFGSDSSFFPRGWNRAILDSQIGVLATLGLPDADVRAILGGNLRD